MTDLDHPKNSHLPCLLISKKIIQHLFLEYIYFKISGIKNGYYLTVPPPFAFDLRSQPLHSGYFSR